MLRVRVAASSPVGLRVRRTWRFKGGRPPPSKGGDLQQRVAAHGRRSAYHLGSGGCHSLHTAAVCCVQAVIWPHGFAVRCARLPPLCSTNAPCLTDEPGAKKNPDRR